MYELYELKKQDVVACDTKCEFKEIEVVNLSKEFFGNTEKGKIIAFIWNVISCGKSKAYIIRDDKGELIHHTCVIYKCYKFPFMEKKDIYIGPSYTRSDFRGLGLVPYVSSTIIRNELNSEAKAYGMINTENVSSIKAFKKIGFIPVALMRKDKFGRHIIVNQYDTLKDIK